MAAISGKVKLVQETDKDVQAGFLMYLPHYRSGMPLDTVEQRQAALQGFVYSPFRANDLMQGILGPQATLLDFKVYDGDSHDEDNLLYVSRQSHDGTGTPPRYVAEERLQLAGRTWTVHFFSSAQFEHEMSNNQPLIIGLGGLAIDGLLYWVILSLSTRRAQALRAANQMEGLVAQLRASEAQLSLQAERAKVLLDLPQWVEQLDEADFMQAGLDQAERLTGSSIAFLHLVHEDQNTLELTTWSTQTLRHFCNAQYDRHYPINQAGIWADAVRQHRAMMCNDYATAEGKHGLPDNHAHLSRFISVPVLDNGKVVLLVGVGNRADFYAESDVDTVQLIADAVWRLVQQQRSEKRLRWLSSAMEQSPSSIFITDNRARIQYVNSAFLAVSGYGLDEVLGQNPSLLQSGKTPPDTYHSLWHSLKHGETWQGELFNRRKDGSEYIDRAIISPLRDEKGQVSNFVAVQQDITEQKRAEQALRESSDRLAAAASAGIVGVWDWDIINNRLIWDSVMYKLYGIQEHDFGGAYEAWARAIHGDDKAYTEGEIQAALRGEREYAPEFRIVWPDGSVHHIKAASRTSYDAQGRAVRMIGVNYDLTEQKNNELALLDAKNKAEAANRAKSDFLANMSHEIRTPMNAVIGLAHLLMDTGLNFRQRDYLSKLNNSARSLLGILNDILDYSKIEAGKLELEEADFELAEVLENTAGLFGFAAEEKGLELVFDIAPDLPPMLVGDPLRIKQVLNNLLGNAVKFTQQGHVRLSMHSLGMQAGHLLLQVSVSDTGLGMTPEQVGRLFQAFEQADTSITRRFGGTGLGLTITKSLVTMMGGSVQVVSELGQGSVFSFTIKLKVSSVPTKHRTAAHLRGMRTLIVDDQEVACDALSHLMAAWTFQADVARSGQEGLSMALKALHRGMPYELILMDWKLPDIDGVELVRCLRAEEKKQSANTPHAIVVMVTAYGRQEAQKAAHEVKFDAILDKPVMPSMLFDLVAGLQDGTLDVGTVRQWNDLQHGRTRMQVIRGAEVLLVEDNPTNQMVAREMLNKLGLQVAIAGNGREAIAQVQAHHYAAILMDLQMPEMDGIEATRRIRELPEGTAVPIIAMTAAALLSDREASQAAGMNDFVSKPIDVTELSSVLLRWIMPSAHGSALPPLPPLQNRGQAFEIPGLALSEAVVRMGGDWGVLRRTVEGFARDFAHSPEHLAQCLEQGQWDDAKRLVHTIKGMAKAIGAMPLHALTEQLDRELGAGQHPSFAAFQAELDATLANIAQHGSTDAVVNTHLAAGRLADIMGLIQQGLDRSLFIAPELVEELIQGLHLEPQRQLGRQLLAQLEVFDYAHAAHTLAELAALCAVDLP